MSIATEITKLNTNLTASYTACSNKGATLPASQNFDNLASCVSSIPTATEPTLASLTVTPSTTAQTITPPSGTDGYNTVTVSAVTASIDSDIQAGNIKSGVNILGVSGTVTELVGETRTVSVTSTSGNTFTPSSGKNGITSIKCNPTNKALTITPSKTSQTKTVPSGYSGYGTVKCNAVTSSIDSNITAGNIKSGVTILGVTGTYEGSGGGGGGNTIRFTQSQFSSVEAYSGYGTFGGTTITSLVDEFLGTVSFIDVVITDELNYFSMLSYNGDETVVLACPYYDEYSPVSLSFWGAGLYFDFCSSAYSPTNEEIYLFFLALNIADGVYEPYTVIVTIPYSS